MTTTYTYTDAAGAYLGTITRNPNDGGKKTFRASKGFPDPRPLYNLEELARRPGAPVLVVEGEKTADAAGKIFPDYVCVTSPFGSMSAAKADWSVLDGRDVTVWPDHDAPGARYAADVAGLVPKAKIVPVPSSFPEAWDLADDLPNGVTCEALAGLLLLAEAPTIKAKKKAKPDLKKSVEEVKRERDGILAKVRALLAKTVENGCTEEEAAAAVAKAREFAQRLLDEFGLSGEDLASMMDVEDDERLGEDIDGDALLNSVRAFLERFVSYPSRHASVAHTLWIAHTHMMDIWDSTPRIAFMSPERGSGKTRALEATEFLVPRPVHSVNNSVAYVIRKIADELGRPTVLYDEVDALFGTKQPEKADLLAILNAGHRKGATSGRCVIQNGRVLTEELPAYAAVALAGLRDLPDTLAARAIQIEMRRRAPDEAVEPFRARIHRPQASPLYLQLKLWGAHTSKQIEGKYPDVPSEITDRDADCWEGLLAIADAAGGDWPDLAREAAVFLVRRGKEIIQTAGVELLQHILEAFGDDDCLSTKELITRLLNRDESPWTDIKGKDLSDRGLAERLKQYGIKSGTVRVRDLTPKGYKAEDFHDAWNRYLNIPPGSRHKRHKRHIVDNENNNVADVADVAARSGNGACSACDGNLGRGCPTCKPENYGMSPRPPGGYGPGRVQ